MSLPTPNATDTVIALRTPTLHIDGMQLSWASNTTLSIAAGTARNSTDENNIVFSTAITLNAAVNGVNGLDTGTFAASTLYHIFAIGISTDPDSAATIMSASLTSPVIPIEYDMARYIGSVASDGSTHFLLFYMSGNNNNRAVFYDQAIQILNNGISQSLASIGSMAACVPAINNTPVYLNVQFTPNAADDNVLFAPGGSTATLIPGVYGNVATKISSAQLKILSRLVSSSPVVLYINSAASGNTDVWLQGYDLVV